MGFLTLVCFFEVHCSMVWPVEEVLHSNWVSNDLTSSSFGSLEQWWSKGDKNPTNAMARVRTLVECHGGLVS